MTREAIVWHRPHLYWFYSPEGYAGHYWASKGVVKQWQGSGYILIRVSHAEGRF